MITKEKVEEILKRNDFIGEEEFFNSQQNKNKYHSERLLLRETEKTGSADTQILKTPLNYELNKNPIKGDN